MWRSSEEGEYENALGQLPATTKQLAMSKTSPGIEVRQDRFCFPDILETGFDPLVDA